MKKNVFCFARAIGSLALAITAWYCAFRGYKKAMLLFCILTLIFCSITAFIKDRYWEED